MSKKNNPKRPPLESVEENVVIETIINNVPQPTSSSTLKSQSAAQSQPTSQTAWFSQSPIPNIEQQQPNATEIGAAVYFYRQKNGLDEKPSVLEINDQDPESLDNDQDPESLESEIEIDLEK